MTDTVSVRRLHRTDAEFFREIRLESLKAEPRAYGSTYEETAKRPLDAFADLLDRGSYFAATDNGRAVGLIGWFAMERPTARHRGSIISVYVASDRRGKGIIDRLIDAVVEDAGAQVRQLELHVTADNPAALGAYRRNGFVEVGCIPDALCHAGVFADEYIMLRRLGA